MIIELFPAEPSPRRGQRAPVGGQAKIGALLAADFGGGAGRSALDADQRMTKAGCGTQIHRTTQTGQRGDGPIGQEAAGIVARRPRTIVPAGKPSTNSASRSASAELAQVSKPRLSNTLPVRGSIAVRL